MIIGITGGIGSGKSTIAQALAQRGYAVYDCDREAKRIIAEDPKVQSAIIDLLGEEAFRDGIYNTAYVSSKVFSPSPEGEVQGEASSLLSRLNAIIHPAVKEDILNHLLLLERVGVRLPFFVESAILYESGLDALCDKVIVIDAPEDIRVARTIARDYHNDTSIENINRVRARIHTQRIPSGDILLLNDNTASINQLTDSLLQQIGIH